MGPKQELQAKLLGPLMKGRVHVDNLNFSQQCFYLSKMKVFVGLSDAVE